MEHRNPPRVSCPNNEGVGCRYPDRCATCGWNKAVGEERLKKVIARLTGKK